MEGHDRDLFFAAVQRSTMLGVVAHQHTIRYESFKMDKRVSSHKAVCERMRLLNSDSVTYRCIYFRRNERVFYLLSAGCRSRCGLD